MGKILRIVIDIILSILFIPLFIFIGWKYFTLYTENLCDWFYKLLMTILPNNGIIGLVVSFIAILLFIIVVPLLLIGFCITLSQGRLEDAINTKNAYMWDYETAHNLPHKKRMNGEQFFNSLGRKIDDTKDTFTDYYESVMGEQSFESETKHFYEKQWKEERKQKRRENQENNTNQNYGNDINKAMALFMLDDMTFTLADLKKIRNRLMKSCHSDNYGNDELSNKQSKKINQAFNLLKQYAK